jgi:hypothetical protein
MIAVALDGDRVPDRYRVADPLSSEGMNQTRGRSGWLEFSRPAFRLRFLYPEVTPQGRPVDITEEEHDGVHRVHLTAREGGELYLEVIRFPHLRPAEEYARHRAYLADRFGPEAVSEPTETSLRSAPAWSYGFRGKELERAVLSLQVGRDTYRIVSDPRAALNDEIIATVRIEQ